MEHPIMTQNPHLQEVTDELIRFFANTYSVYLKTQNFHWNVTGPYFYSLHKMFEEQYLELAAAVDELAERIRALGSLTPASFSQFLKLSSIKEQTTALDAENMIQALLKDHETLSSHATTIIAAAQKARDEDTADLLIQRLKSHEKTAWMLRSSLKK
jgi:starvation-inducible DNA-binding protein